MTGDPISRSFVVRGPDPWNIYGPFNSAQEAVWWGQGEWPDMPQGRPEDEASVSMCWIVKPLYPRGVK